MKFSALVPAAKMNSICWCKDVPCCVKVLFRNEIKVVEIPWNFFSFDTFKDACELFFHIVQPFPCAGQQNVFFIYSSSHFVLVIAEFKVEITDGSNSVLILSDNMGTPITRDKFVNNIKTFHGGSTYYINVKYESAFADASSIFVSPMVRPILRLYFTVQYGAS